MSPDICENDVSPGSSTVYNFHNPVVWFTIRLSVFYAGTLSFVTLRKIFIQKRSSTTYIRTYVRT